MWTFAVNDNYNVAGTYTIYLRALSVGDATAFKQINIDVRANCENVTTKDTGLDKDQIFYDLDLGLTQIYTDDITALFTTTSNATCTLIYKI